jgi:hypothetical protein
MDLVGKSGGINDLLKAKQTVIYNKKWCKHSQSSLLTKFRVSSVKQSRFISAVFAEMTTRSCHRKIYYENGI